MAKQHMLVGRTITSVDIASDKKAIRFNTVEGPVVAKTDGDCCSSSWIEHVSLPFNGFPVVVKAAYDVDMPDLGSPDEYEVIAYYGFKVETDKGDIVMDYRNSSNGYYGGSLSWPDDSYFYGGVYGQNVSSEEWQPLTKDF